MPADVGPYDGRRARRKRCDACVKRRIKCHGGTPCETCRRMDRQCKTTIKGTTSGPVFVGQNTQAVITSTKNDSKVPQCVSPKGLNRNLPYFFVSFLPMNIFTGEKVPMGLELLDLAKTSPALRDAIHAVAALHRRQHCQLTFTKEDVYNDLAESLEAYDQAVRCILDRIDSNDLLEDPSALWTTFLLGLFELMRDSTGTNWLSHFLHGTCTILRLQDPDTLSSLGVDNTQKRTFFLATRTFEIARSLIYSSPTFLSELRWTSALAKLWSGAGADLWHPKEALFDMLPHISALSIRAARFCETAKELPVDTQRAQIQSLANKSLVLGESLQLWWSDTVAWDQATQYPIMNNGIQRKPDIELMVGYLYYHAISIYISGTYDYHVHWTCFGAPHAPVLSQSTIDWHVVEILRLSQELLKLGAAGVLLFFPLRVAGARVMDLCSRCDILNLLHTVQQRGFVVATAFTLDLSELWVG
ncbi:hypothetical protein EK21DRAFT_96646 [Setomelanomma holmii]|uniref:Zn(2)-C6 fungal-type domain-containing protein n=1 Tax=Setomelanomma holmii TaxID=210430 RepID=A0A9P4LPT4_9PLEO|nr:hypothetical protein EK21DRAFT_96646 [Setomelanomma holmii]